MLATCHEKFGTPGPDISKYLNHHGTNISGIAVEFQESQWMKYLD